MLTLEGEHYVQRAKRLEISLRVQSKFHNGVSWNSRYALFSYVIFGVVVIQINQGIDLINFNRSGIEILLEIPSIFVDACSNPSE
jgi:hypothetical protein